jgi:hypothetical protein
VLKQLIEKHTFYTSSVLLLMVETYALLHTITVCFSKEKHTMTVCELWQCPAKQVLKCCDNGVTLSVFGRHFICTGSVSCITTI